MCSLSCILHDKRGKIIIYFSVIINNTSRSIKSNNVVLLFNRYMYIRHKAWHSYVLM